MVGGSCRERTCARRASVNEPSVCRKNADKFPQRPYPALNADSSADTSGPNFGGLASKDGVIP